MADQISREAIDAVLAGHQARELESDRLDFKTLGRSREDSLIDLAEVAACLANSKGGHIVVNVADAGRGLSALIGSVSLKWCARRPCR